MGIRNFGLFFILMLLLFGPFTSLSKKMNSVGLVCLLSPSVGNRVSYVSCVSEWLVLQLSISISYFLIYFDSHVLSSFKNKFISYSYHIAMLVAGKR